MIFAVVVVAVVLIWQGISQFSLFGDDGDLRNWKLAFMGHAFSASVVGVSLLRESREMVFYLHMRSSIPRKRGLRALLQKSSVKNLFLYYYLLHGKYRQKMYIL